MDTSFQKTTGSDEWYTPKEIIDSLGEFELDPCAPEHPLWRTAKIMWNKVDDGLSKDWRGMRIWLNPPYSQPLITRFCEMFVKNGNGICLLFGRTGNKIFQDIMFPNADAVLFLRKRIRFFRPDGTQGASGGCDSVLFALGQENVLRLAEAGLEGVLIHLKTTIRTRRPTI